MSHFAINGQRPAYIQPAAVAGTAQALISALSRRFILVFVTSHQERLYALIVAYLARRGRVLGGIARQLG
jgi:hypothetical protein